MSAKIHSFVHLRTCKNDDGFLFCFVKIKEFSQNKIKNNTKKVVDVMQPKFFDYLKGHVDVY